MSSGNRNCHLQMQFNRNHNGLHFKCNRNQRLLSQLHKMSDYLPWNIMPAIWWVYKAKDNNTTDLSIDGLLSYLNTWWFVSLFVLWTWKDNVLKHCFRCCRYYKSYKQAFQINLCLFHKVKPKLVTQSAIVHDFFLTSSF